MQRLLLTFLFIALIFIKVFAQCPAIDAGQNVPICIGNSAQLNATGGTTYSWAPAAGLNNTAINNPIASPLTTTTYHVTSQVPFGDVIYNGDFEQGYTGFSSSYTYQSNLYPEGTFYIGTNPNSYHNSFSSCTDHTSGAGNMMIVNGSGVPNINVWCQTILITPNTDYDFSTWATSVNPGSPAILQFSINGQLLGTPFILSSATCTWNEFFAIWNSGSDSTADICIVNQNTSLGGNDFALDDISFSPLCFSTDSVIVTVTNVIAEAGNNQTVCPGTNVTLTATGGTSYQWNNGVTQGVPFIASATTTYTVTVTDANGCSATDNVEVYVGPLPLLPPPDMRCASVVSNGDVWLTWIPPVDTMNSYNSFHIYSSTSLSVPFTLVDSVFGVGQNSYTHTGANANTQSLYYYIKTRSGCNGVYYSISSDTLQTIFLNVVNSGAGTAVLTWNPIHNPNLPTSLGWYHIYREYPPGILTLIDSTQSLSYIDSITLCNALINYYVDIDDSIGCSSMSSIDGDLFQDIIAPSTPMIDSVTVDSLSGRSVITWHSSSLSDTQGYIIYENINGIWVPIDTILGVGITTYTNIHSTWANPDLTSLSYCVAAFDSCQNTSPISSNHNTIYLTSDLNVCDGKVTLNWTPYVNMHPGLMGYRIYVKKNNGPVTLLVTNSTTNLSFIHSSLTQSSEYIYCIQAFDSSGAVTSTSNTDTIVVYLTAQPQYAYLRYATVANNDHVRIKCLIDITAYISKCKIMRSDNATGPFTQIATVSPNLTPFITYDDYSAYVNQQSYYYKVIAVDSCGNDAVTSNIGRSIYLLAELSNDMKNTLTWNEYENWLGGVSMYNLYRKVDEVWDSTPLVTLSSASNTYIDDVSDFISANGKFGYMIEAIEGVGNPYLFSDTSLSNEVVVIQQPRFYVPNAFVPESINNIFIPLNVFVNSEDYKFLIFNRWGQVVFQTGDPKAGWDGTTNGSSSPQGVYVYIIKYKNSQNKYIEKRGTVTLLR